MKRINTISDFVPRGAEAGVGLAIQDDQCRYVFFLAGTMHKCPPGEIFYAGIGGHKEAGENWLDCAYREVREEIDTQVEIISSATTWLIKTGKKIKRITLDDQPTPFVLYEMIHPVDTPRAGGLYRIVIYNARLQGKPKNLQKNEVLGVIALTKKQVHAGLNSKSTLGALLNEGGQLIAGGEDLERATILYPLGTARALAEIIHLTWGK